MNTKYIFLVFILKNYLLSIIGPHYPTELILLIIMANYQHYKISCGFKHACLMLDKIYVWGENANGELGLGHTDNIYTPQELILKDAVDIICGGFHTIASTQIPNEIYVWGSNDDGQLGLGHRSSMYVPTKLILPEPIVSVSCGGYHTIALTQSENLYVWGCNNSGQLGIHIANTCLPQKVVLNKKIISIGCGDNHTIISTKSANNSEMHLLQFDKSQQIPLQDINIRSIRCGSYHNIALVNSDSNVLYVWGSNSFGQLGVRHTRNTKLPQKLVFDKPIVSVSCGEHHTVALTLEGTMYVWGKNVSGQLGLGNAVDYNSPQKLILRNSFGEFESVVAVCCGDDYTTAITNKNKIYVWGKNNYNQLGLGDDVTRFSPQELKF